MKNWPIGLAALILAGCSTGETHPVPKRTAYPRTAVLPDSTTLSTVGPIKLKINSSAAISHPRADWLDAKYTDLGATLHLSTMQNADEADKANRRERISLNLGGVSATIKSFTTPSGFDCEVISTAEGPATPVQFLAVRDGQMLSGAFVLSGKTTPADSIRPIVAELEREAISILNSVVVQ